MKNRKSIEDLEKMVKEKIRLGILPEGAEIATCDQPGCIHWSHKLEKKRTADEQGLLKKEE